MQALKTRRFDAPGVALPLHAARIRHHEGASNLPFVRPAGRPSCGEVGLDQTLSTGSPSFDLGERFGATEVPRRWRQECRPL
jgi:hypothetical protein